MYNIEGSNENWLVVDERDIADSRDSDDERANYYEHRENTTPPTLPVLFYSLITATHTYLPTCPFHIIKENLPDLLLLLRVGKLTIDVQLVV